MTDVRAVVFDLDGTLCDTIPDIGGSFNRAFAHVGLPTRPVREYGQFVGYGIRENLHRAAPAGTPEDVEAEALRFYLADYPEHCADSTVPYPGIRELISALSERGVKLAVVTNKTEATAKRLLDALFPEKPFVLIWGRQEGRALKPSRELGDAVSEALGVPSENILGVGDGDSDVKWALNSGFQSVAVTWGYRTRDQLTAAGAKRFADAPGEIQRSI